MFSEVMEFFGLEKELDHLGFFETTSQKHLAQELKVAIAQGRLIAISGVVGSGKTTFLQKLMADLTKSKEVVVSRSLAVESDKVRMVTLITALFYDLSTDKVEKVPSNSEKTDILSSETLSYLSKRLSTPLQIEQYLTLAMNEAYQVGLKLRSCTKKS